MANLRTAAALTTSYVASTAIYCGNAQYVAVGFDFVYGSATSVEWYYGWASSAAAAGVAATSRPETVTSTTSATTTHLVAANTIAVTATATWTDRIRPQNAYLVVWVKRTGGSASDTLAVAAELL